MGIHKGEGVFDGHSSNQDNKEQGTAPTTALLFTSCNTDVADAAVLAIGIYGRYSIVCPIHYVAGKCILSERMDTSCDDENIRLRGKSQVSITSG